MSKPRLIAFYLPQFYPTKENDEWWGKGFTEWTNVGRAKPLFRGHYQPRVPADLGYYDLRIPEVREQQAELAKLAGIEGFCYWHYWFGNGKRLLDRVFSEVVESGKPDYPFCLCWANHSWYQKTWDPTKADKLLVEQTYPGVKDFEDHFYAMLPAFKDKRYIKVNGKLLFGIFAPRYFKEIETFKKVWNQLAEQNGLKGFYFFAYLSTPSALDDVRTHYDMTCVDYFMDIIKARKSFVRRTLKGLAHKVLHRPYSYDYASYIDEIIEHVGEDKAITPCLLPNYDHSPRSGANAMLLHKSTPLLWKKLLNGVVMKRNGVAYEENILFLKAWNEWGEGNYLEPDLIYGKQYLDAIRDVLDNVK